MSASNHDAILRTTSTDKIQRSVEELKEMYSENVILCPSVAGRQFCLDAIDDVAKGRRKVGRVEVCKVQDLDLGTYQTAIS